MIPKRKTQNLVAKFAKRFNKSTVEVDRKGAEKRGKVKHKGKQYV